MQTRKDSGYVDIDLSKMSKDDLIFIVKTAHENNFTILQTLDHFVKISCINLSNALKEVLAKNLKIL